MFDGNDGDIQANHLSSLACIVSGRAYDVFAGHDALVGRHLPGTGGYLLDIEYLGVSVYRRTPGTRAFRECLSQVRRLDVTVVRMKDAADQFVDIAHWPEFEDVIRRQEPDIDTNRLCCGCVLVILVHTIGIHCEAQVTYLCEANRLPRFFLETAVQVH